MKSVGERDSDHESRLGVSVLTWGRFHPESWVFLPAQALVDEALSDFGEYDAFQFIPMFNQVHHFYVWVV